MNSLGSILIVDDDAAMRQVILSMVKGLDAEAVAVGSGDDALEKIAEILRLSHGNKGASR